MNGRISNRDDRRLLIDAAINGSITAGQAARLQSLLENDRAACEMYAEYARIEAELHLLTRGRMANQAVFRDINTYERVSVAVSGCEGAAVPGVAPVAPNFFAGAWQGAIATFSQVGPLSYLVATVVMAAMLLSAWAYKITHDYRDLAQNNSRRSTTSGSTAPQRPELVFVGRVTGLKDCRWADPQTETFAGAAVPLGRKYALSSGLMEITYRSGAKVILEGPCSYEVESDRGGFLALGKLTAKVEKNSEFGIRNSEKRTQANSQFPIPNSELFSVRTPTAIVTDLGTEFGLEVNERGETISHVFAGKVRLAVIGRREDGAVFEQVLHAGQTGRVEGDRVEAAADAAGGARFVRLLPAREAPPEIVLIGRLDYSDTWTADTSARPGSYVPLESPESLLVEQCHGNPPRSWVFSTPTVAAIWPGGPITEFWPGYQISGAKSGFSESVQEGVCYLGLEYGLRDDFVVQLDAVQTDDRINITIGDQPATVHSARSLSVFFRPPGTGKFPNGKEYPEIGLFTPSMGEADVQIRSGISAPFQWHNYAVRFNLREKRIMVWVDRVYRGTIDLAAEIKATGPIFRDGPEARSDARHSSSHKSAPSPVSNPWADICTNQYITVGGFSDNIAIKVWTDNFRVGAPAKDIVTGNP